MIYPATQAHIDKYSADKRYLARETAEIYYKFSKPLLIDQIDHKTANSWIYNVLDGTKEKELEVFSNEFFSLGKDWEFNEGDLETLYCLALPR